MELLTATGPRLSNTVAPLAGIRTGNRADAKTSRRRATERRVIAGGRQEEVTGVLRQALATPPTGARAGGGGDRVGNQRVQEHSQRNQPKRVRRIGHERKRGASQSISRFVQHGRFAWRWRSKWWRREAEVGHENHKEREKDALKTVWLFRCGCCVRPCPGRVSRARRNVRAIPRLPQLH